LTISISVFLTNEKPMSVFLTNKEPISVFKKKKTTQNKKILQREKIRYF